MFSSALYLPLVTAQAVVAPPKAINTFCCLKYCACVFKHDALIFQTPSICVRSSAMRAAAGPAPWPPPSDADVVPRQKLVETPVQHLSSYFVFDSKQLKLFCFSGGSMCHDPKRRWDLSPSRCNWIPWTLHLPHLLSAFNFWLLLFQISSSSLVRSAATRNGRVADTSVASCVVLWVLYSRLYSPKTSGSS